MLEEWVVDFGNLFFFRNRERERLLNAKRMGGVGINEKEFQKKTVYEFMYLEEDCRCIF